MPRYVGRFAPSPTGRLHFGSLFGAVISYLHARVNSGSWLVRIEDIDPPREQEGAANDILSCLEAHGLRADHPPLYQSNAYARYEEKLDRLRKTSATYQCPCSRKQMQEAGAHSAECISQSSLQSPCAIRFKSDNRSYTWNDLYQGHQNRTLDEDFVLKRKDGLYAYQLAVVSDDIDQGITHVIRGSDLIDSTPMQLAIYEALSAVPPIYGHFPVLVNQSGQKLSKQNLSKVVRAEDAIKNLMEVMALLGISLPRTPSSTQEILSYAERHWQQDNLKHCLSMTAPSAYC